MRGFESAPQRCRCVAFVDHWIRPHTVLAARARAADALGSTVWANSMSHNNPEQFGTVRGVPCCALVLRKPLTLRNGVRLTILPHSLAPGATCSRCATLCRSTICGILHRTTTAPGDSYARMCSDLPVSANEDYARCNGQTATVRGCLR